MPRSQVSVTGNPPTHEIVELRPQESYTGAHGRSLIGMVGRYLRNHRSAVMISKTFIPSMIEVESVTHPLFFKLRDPDTRVFPLAKLINPSMLTSWSRG